jgi:hypothetical protein
MLFKNTATTTATTTTQPLIPNKVGYARNETQSKIVEIKDFKYQKSMIVIVNLLLQA